MDLLGTELPRSTGAALTGLTSFLRLAAHTDLGLMLIKLNDLILVKRLLVNTGTQSLGLTDELENCSSFTPQSKNCCGLLTAFGEHSTHFYNCSVKTDKMNVGGGGGLQKG